MNQTVIPNFPVFTASVRLTNYSQLPSLISTLINEPPLERVLVLPYPTSISELLTCIGYKVRYGDLKTEVLISDTYEDGYKAVVIPNRCMSKIPEGFAQYFASGWSIIISNSYRQRRVDLPGYFNEVGMLHMRLKEMYSDFDLFIIGQMDTPYSSNTLIEQGYPEIEDPEGKVKLLTLSYPQEIKDMNNAWVKDWCYLRNIIFITH